MQFFDREIKKLGFGLMRLPKKDDVIDIEQVKEMVDRFMAAGFTYFDTAWAYDGSEEAIRKALVERYPRESFQLATKNA
ncbi:MAG: aldo/keto reductase, partial [Ruminococcus sp.]|nr:aldo/keto reductase [Ruminococcus sp.]